MHKDWESTTLGDIATLTIGRTPSRNDPSFWTTDLSRPFCSIADMTGPVVVPTREGVTQVAEEAGKAKRVPAGSLLMSFKLTIGRVGFAGCDLFPNEAIVWVEPRERDEVDKKFLASLLGAYDYSPFIASAIKGGTLNLTSMKSLPLRIPELDEQIRIADLMAAVDDEFDALREARARTEILRTALLQDLLSGAHRIPESYDRLLKKQAATSGAEAAQGQESNQAAA